MSGGSRRGPGRALTASLLALAIAWLAGRGAPEGRAVVFGHSLGGGVAIEAAPAPGRWVEVAGGRHDDTWLGAGNASVDIWQDLLDEVMP